MQKRYPFKFLDSYTREDSDFFFGRTEEVEQLYQMIFQSDLLLVYGASGTGKTSMIQCGLASKFQSHDWLALNIRRGSDLNISLEKSLKEAGGEIDNLSEELDWLDEDWLVGRGVLTQAKAIGTKETIIGKRLNAVYRRHFKPIYLIFDQFEELYILGSKAEQRQFIQSVGEILQVDQPVKIIISIREEYLGHLYEFERAVPSLLRKKLRVEPMNLDKVRTVIKGIGSLPQSCVSLKAGEEEAIADALFDKIRDKENSLSISLPYLQVVLDKLYLQISGDETRQASAEFSLAATRKMAGIGDVLRNFLDEQVMLTAKRLNQDPVQIWNILSPFVTLDGTKEPVSEALLQKRLPDIGSKLLKDILQIFINQRLVRYYKDDQLYEIAHDSLAKKIAEKRSDEEVALLRVQQIIKGQIVYTAEARFFSEQQLNFIKPFLQKLKLSKEEEALIAESERVIAQKQEDLLAAQKEEYEKMKAQAEKEKKLKRRAIYIAGIAVISSIVAFFLFFWAQSAEKSAMAAQKVATEKSDSLAIQIGISEENKRLADVARDSAVTLLEEVKKQKGISEQAVQETAEAIKAKDKEEADKIAAEKAKNAAILKNLDIKIEEIKTLIKIDDKDGAKKMLEEVLKAAPNHPELLKLKQQLK